MRAARRDYHLSRGFDICTFVFWTFLLTTVLSTDIKKPDQRVIYNFAAKIDLLFVLINLYILCFEFPIIITKTITGRRKLPSHHDRTHKNKPPISRAKMKISGNRRVHCDFPKSLLLLAWSNLIVYFSGGRKEKCKITSFKGTTYIGKVLALA